MGKLLKTAFILVGTGFVLSLIFHVGVMLDCIPLQPNHILYASLALILFLFPGMSVSRKAGLDVGIEGFFKTSLQVFPIWLTAGLGAVLAYGICIFINYTYIHSPLTAKHDMPQVVDLLNRGSSAGTLVFYTIQLWLLNLYWRVQKIK